MTIKPIRTEQDYRSALDVLEQLMDAEPGSPEEEQLEVLGTLVWAYEQQHDPVGKVPRDVRPADRHAGAGSAAARTARGPDRGVRRARRLVRGPH